LCFALLCTGASGEYKLAFVMKSIGMPQKLRGTLSYMVSCPSITFSTLSLHRYFVFLSTPGRNRRREKRRRNKKRQTNKQTYSERRKERAGKKRKSRKERTREGICLLSFILSLLLFLSYL
jgi:hypothetical protein